MIMVMMVSFRNNFVQARKNPYLQAVHTFSRKRHAPQTAESGKKTCLFHIREHARAMGQRFKKLFIPGFYASVRTMRFVYQPVVVSFRKATTDGPE